jgi:hypothetical protein
MKKRTKDILLKVVVVYGFLAVLGVLILNYTYVLDHGWKQWATHGWSVSTFKGVCTPVLIPYYIVKEYVDNRQIEVEIEADPWSQSVLRAAEAMRMVGTRSFADLDRNTQRKIIIKCAEARVLATLPLTQQPETDNQDFDRYLLGLDIVAHKGHVLAPEKIDKALEMIRDYLYQQYGQYEEY